MPVKVKIQQIQAAFERTYKQLMQAPVYTDTAKAYAALMEKRTVQGEEIPPTKEQWKELYEVTVNIRNLAPWRVLDESERIALILPGRDEPVYIVVMGYGGMTYGIGIYPGYDSLHRLGRLLNGEID